METKGFSRNEISQKNKEALQSETWQEARKVMKTEVQHFKDAPEIQHFATEKVSKNDNVYGVVWGNVVGEYLNTAYSGENTQADVISDGVTYKVLKREKVTVFYDANGNTLFDVENKRLEKEYGYVMKEGPLQKGVVTGVDKLKDEENQMLQSVRPEHREVMKAQFDLLFKELIDWTRKDPEFEKMVLMPHKNMKRCMKFCSDKAMGIREPSDKEKTEARNNGVPIVTPVGSNMLLTWIREYYERDDKEEVEKEAKKAAEEKKCKTSRKKKEQENKKKTGSSEKKPKAKAVSPKKKEMDNQISIFDVMEV